ncbi:hypothetical protein ES702_01569 [subsurface metagenome]
MTAVRATILPNRGLIDTATFDRDELTKHLATSLGGRFPLFYIYLCSPAHNYEHLVSCFTACYVDSYEVSVIPRLPHDYF